MSEIFVIKDKLDCEYIHIYREYTSKDANYVVEGSMIHVSAIHVDDFYEIFEFPVSNESSLKEGFWINIFI